MVQRKKKVIVTGVSREEADEAFGVYATADAEISKINASMELQFAKIREKNAERLTLLQAERESAFEVLQAYAVENKDSLFAKKKSLELTHGVIGFRTGTPKLKTLKGFTWASALELVRRFLGFAYVRTVDELAKDRLLADRELAQAARVHKAKRDKSVLVRFFTGFVDKIFDCKNTIFFCNSLLNIFNLNIDS